jgi:Flp pilus assembly protein CpaB
MEMEFKDNSRRRTLVLVVGVLLALAAGAAAFTLSSQGTDDAEEPTFATRDVVVAAVPIDARDTIEPQMVSLRPVPLDDTNASAFTDRDEVVGKIAAIPIVQFQPITPNMLSVSTGRGQVAILDPDETVAPDSPIWRAVSLTVPAERAVGGLIADGQRVDIIATLPIEVSLPVDDETGEPLATGEDGDPLPFTSGQSTKLMWLDMKVISHPADTATYIVRADLQTSEEIAHAQNQGAAFTMVLRPEIDTRDVDRSNYGETTDQLLTRYNFRVPEIIDGVEYPQPISFPSPFPAEPYLSPAPSEAPLPSPDAALIEVPGLPETAEESPSP